MNLERQISQTQHVEAVVVGAGVIGLAVARALASEGPQVVVLEEQPQIGTQTSSRSSEVIHSGINYEPKSLKATLCVQGRTRLYEYCEGNNIRHEKVGKFVVATSDEEIGKLRELETN